MAKEKKSAALSLKHGGGVVMAWLPVETTGVYGCTLLGFRQTLQN